MAYRPDPSIVLSYPPRTDGLSDQILQGGSSVQAWWYDVLCRGYYAFSGRNETIVYWEDRISSNFLYDCYLDWCRAAKIPYPKGRYVFSRELFGKKGLCISERTTSRAGGKAENVRIVGTLEESREKFRVALRLPNSFKFEDSFD